MHKHIPEKSYFKTKTELQNRVHIQADWGFFIGKFADNILHKHYALQISVTAEEPFRITDEHGERTTYSSCFINSNVLHQFQSDQASLILLINPISSIGHQLSIKYKGVSIVDADKEFKELSSLFRSFVQEQITFADLVKQLNVMWTDWKCGCEQQDHVAHDRIYKAIQYLEAHADRVVPLKEIAAQCFLSETRFSHLFKERTGLNFRRYQIWNKLVRSLPFLTQRSITETAHQFGFTDSPHYNRSFKETFGLTPKILSQLK